MKRGCASKALVTGGGGRSQGKGAIKWTRLSCRSFAANAVRLQLHALAYNLGNFLRTLATPEPIKHWSPTTLKERLIKIDAKVVSHGRYVAFQMTEVANSRDLFADILRLIAGLRPPPIVSSAYAFCSPASADASAEVRLDEGMTSVFQHRTGGGSKSDGTDSKHTGYALSGERKGGRMRLKPTAI